MAERPEATELEALVGRISACQICSVCPSGRPLPHAPRPVLRVSRTARLAIAGQAPGARVHRSGIPFADPSGVRLRAWMGVTEDEFYDQHRIAILPMGFCFPGLDAKGGDLPPRRECAPAWRDDLLQAMPQIELILAIGQYAQWWHLQGKRRPVTEVVRGVVNGCVTVGCRRVLALPHPSWRNSGWLKANPWFEQAVVPQLQREVRRLIVS